MYEIQYFNSSLEQIGFAFFHGFFLNLGGKFKNVQVFFFNTKSTRLPRFGSLTHVKFLLVLHYNQCVMQIIPMVMPVIMGGDEGIKERFGGDEYEEKIEAMFRSGH